MRGAGLGPVRHEPFSAGRANARPRRPPQIGESVGPGSNTVEILWSGGLSGPVVQSGSDVLHATAPAPPHGQGTHSFGVGPNQLAGARLTHPTRPVRASEWGQLQCRSGAN